MLHKAWNSKEKMPYCFPRSSIKFQGHTGQDITDFDPNWAFPDYRPVAAFKSLRFALFYIKLFSVFCFLSNCFLFDCSKYSVLGYSINIDMTCWNQHEFLECFGSQKTLLKPMMTLSFDWVCATRPRNVHSFPRWICHHMAHPLNIMTTITFLYHGYQAPASYTSSNRIDLHSQANNYVLSIL